MITLSAQIMDIIIGEANKLLKLNPTHTVSSSAASQEHRIIIQDIAWNIQHAGDLADLWHSNMETNSEHINGTWAIRVSGGELWRQCRLIQAAAFFWANIITILVILYFAGKVEFSSYYLPFLTLSAYVHER